MRPYVPAVLLAVALVMVGCAPSEEPAQPTPTTSVPPVTAPAEEPAVSGWGSVEFAYGFATVPIPEDATITTSELGTVGTAPRWGGGFAEITLRDGKRIWVNVFSAAGYATAQSGPPCGDVVLASFPGAAGIGLDNEVWFVTAVSGEYRSNSLLLSAGAPLGQMCAPQGMLPAPEGGAVSAVLSESSSGTVTEDELVQWIDSEDGQAAVRVLQSVTVR